ncbi:MAG: hypothetical protein CVU57_29540 [Deltaproteobacteria bacterium HGW-Deltaproteobacteria-15]|jgi:hypothetical protein|nr:MAG: hypothetical protein CVU57_29540 [Deltaproteobacteria bacterium HGW-Deltaproteobacteria-15]
MIPPITTLSLDSARDFMDLRKDRENRSQKTGRVAAAGHSVRPGDFIDNLAAQKNEPFTPTFINAYV